MKHLIFAMTVGVFLRGSLEAHERAIAIDLGDGVKLEFVLIHPGSFMMGDDGDRDAKPAHKIDIAKSFYLGKYEITQSQWTAVMGSIHAHTTTKGATLPVDTVEWWECQEFCAKLNARFADNTFRLPTEAEWEYACRAGSTAKYCFGDDVAQLSDFGWYRRDDDRNPNPKVTGIADTHPVGEKKPNAWGLYDMHGNVWEWCQSRFGAYPYTADDGRETAFPKITLNKKDPKSMVDAKVLRGGSWHHGAKACTAISRAASPPADHRYYYGYRVAMTIQP